MFSFDDNDAELDDLRAEARFNRRQANTLARAHGRSMYDPTNTEAPEAAVNYPEESEN